MYLGTRKEEYLASTYSLYVVRGNNKGPENGETSRDSLPQHYLLFLINSVYRQRLIDTGRFPEMIS